MATLNELVSVCARLTGKPEKSVNVLAMMLRKAGLIRSKRGGYAAEMAPADAAALLVSIMAGGFSTQTASTTARVLSAAWLYIYPRPEGAGPYALPPVKALQSFAVGETFGKALQTIIAEIVVDGDLHDLATGDPMAVEVSISRSAAFGFTCKIGLGRIPGILDWFLHFEVWPEGTDAMSVDERTSFIRRTSTYEESAKIDRRALKELAGCLRQGGEV